MNPRTQKQATRKTPRMDRQVQRIIFALRAKPMTVPQLADALYIGRHSAGNYVRMLYEQKVIRISGWQPAIANKPARIYGCGSAPDAVYVTKRDVKPEPRADVARERILALLALPQTVRQVAAASGFSVSRARDLVSDLKQEGRIHITAWNQPLIKGSQAPVYAQGNKPDAVRLRRAGMRKPKPATAKVLDFMINIAETTVYGEIDEQKAA